MQVEVTLKGGFADRVQNGRVQVHPPAAGG